MVWTRLALLLVTIHRGRSARTKGNTVCSFSLFQPTFNSAASLLSANLTLLNSSTAALLCRCTPDSPLLLLLVFRLGGGGGWGAMGRTAYGIHTAEYVTRCGGVASVVPSH